MRQGVKSSSGTIILLNHPGTPGKRLVETKVPMRYDHPNFMKLFIALLAVPWLCACSSNLIYRPASGPERVEMDRDQLDVYPGDVRNNPDQYANTGVGWAGVIVRTDAKQGDDGYIHAVTTFEHHYFDWEQDRRFCDIALNVSPRGECLFRTEWVLQRTDANAGTEAAESYASPGKLAIVYGVPEKVDDGTVVLKYRLLRVVDEDHFNTNRFDYGRFGQPFHYIDSSAGKSPFPLQNP